MAILQKMMILQRTVNEVVEKTIDRLAKKQLAHARRQYELDYGKSLNAQEEMEIKKGVVLRIAFFVCMPLLVLLMTLMNGGVR